MLRLVRDIIYSSIVNLFNNQPDILSHTSMTGMTEWNLGHHLANELAKYIFWLDNDNDVSKRYYAQRRPDIIFHRRNANSLNFLVVELKRNHCSQDDLNRIKEDWMHEPLLYRFGAHIVIQDRGTFGGEVIGSEKEIVPIGDCSSYISIPVVSVNTKEHMRNLVNEAKRLEKLYRHNQAELDELDYLFYTIFKGH